MIVRANQREDFRGGKQTLTIDNHEFGRMVMKQDSTDQLAPLDGARAEHLCCLEKPTHFILGLGPLEHNVHLFLVLIVLMKHLNPINPLSAYAALASSRLVTLAAQSPC